jgi:pimeloyl-ACP methyl ester carboxylesterase
MTADAAPSPAGRSALTGLDERSRWIDLGGPVHYLDFGGPTNAPVIVCVHGLGGSAVNWSAIAPLLTDRSRVLALDLAGHGLTRSNGRGTRVIENRALLHRFIESVPGAPVILMGNSMGGMISLIETAEAPDAVAGLILVDPALPFVPTRPDPVVAAMFAAYATPGLGWALIAARRRMSPEAAVAMTLSLCTVDASRIPADVVAQHVAIARRRAQFADASRDFLAAARSVSATTGYIRGSAYRRGIRSITAPVLLLHGDRDRLVPIAVARAAARANPSWSLIVLPDIGHVPQLEAPHDTARAVLDWLDADGRRAVETATHRLGGLRHDDAGR